VKTVPFVVKPRSVRLGALCDEVRSLHDRFRLASRLPPRCAPAHHFMQMRERICADASANTLETPICSGFFEAFCTACDEQASRRDQRESGRYTSDRRLTCANKNAAGLLGRAAFMF